MKNVIYTTRETTIYELLKKHIDHVYFIMWVCMCSVLNIIFQIYLSHINNEQYCENSKCLEIIDFLLEKYYFSVWLSVFFIILALFIILIELKKNKYYEYLNILLYGMWILGGLFNNMIISYDSRIDNNSFELMQDSMVSFVVAVMVIDVISIMAMLISIVPLIAFGFSYVDIFCIWLFTKIGEIKIRYVEKQIIDKV